MKLILFLPIFFFTNTLAQTAKDEFSSFEYTAELSQKLMAIKDLKPDEYVGKIDSYRDQLEKYIDHKKRVCNGEFSTVTLTAGGETNTRKNKLSKEERDLCFRELKALQITFINNMFVARKNYLDELHKKRINELSDAREESIKGVQLSFDRGMRSNTRPKGKKN